MLKLDEMRRKKGQNKERPDKLKEKGTKWRERIKIK